MKVLVTGCAGFIGMHTTLALLKRGDQVFGVDNMNDYYDVQLKQDRLEQLLHSTFGFEQLDIADTAAMTRLFAEIKRMPIFRATSWGLPTCLKVAATTMSNTLFMPVVPVSTAPTPKCRSACMTT
jgi:nucleoside-diphosphate-sugar epimerase